MSIRIFLLLGAPCLYEGYVKPHFVATALKQLERTYLKLGEPESARKLVGWRAKDRTLKHGFGPDMQWDILKKTRMEIARPNQNKKNYMSSLFFDRALIVRSFRFWVAHSTYVLIC